MRTAAHLALCPCTGCEKKFYIFCFFVDLYRIQARALFFGEGAKAPLVIVCVCARTIRAIINAPPATKPTYILTYVCK